jgi:hypothetical protein
VSAKKSPLWVITYPLDNSGPDWGLQKSIVGTPKDLAKLFDLNQLPCTRLLLKGKKADRYIRRALRRSVKQTLKDERLIRIREQREQLTGSAAELQNKGQHR